MCRKSSSLFFLMVFFCMAVAGTFLDAGRQAATADRERRAAYLIVERLGLTDPALFTEASYTRHLSQADRHTAFGSHPAALEHFPTGSLVPPPEHLKQ